MQPHQRAGTARGCLVARWPGPRVRSGDRAIESNLDADHGDGRTGDRADIRVNYSWSNGVHTSVVARKLVTGSKLDVQFDNLAGRYLFGFAAFDNAQVQHATVDDPLTLVFAR